MTQRPSGRRDGFTLLELLLAAAIGAGVLLAALALWQTGARDQRIAAERAAEFRRMTRLRERLRRDLANAFFTGAAIAGRFQGRSSGGPRPLSGEILFLQLTTTAEPPAADEIGADVALVEYRLAPDGVLRRAVRRDLLATVWDDLEGMALMDGVADVELAFYDGAAWSAEWDAEKAGGLPAAAVVRLRWRGEGDTARRPPFELVVPIEHGANTGGAS